MTSPASTSTLTADSLVWQHVFWPTPLLESDVTGLLRHWASERQSPTVYLEARAEGGRLTYLVGSKLRHASTIRRSIEQMVHGVTVSDFDGDRGPVTTGRQVTVSNPARSLTPTDPVGSARSVLTALTAAGKGERLVLQLILGRRWSPRYISDSAPSSSQSVTALILQGHRSEPADQLRAHRIKVAQHGFSLVVRVGVSADTEQRRRRLALGVTAALATIEAPGVRVGIKHGSASAINHAATPRFGWRWPLRLNVEEVARMSGLPIGDADFPGQPAPHPRPIRPSPLVATGERIVATANAPGVTATLGYSMVDATRHSWLLGPNGTGKSTLLLNLIVQDLLAGRGMVVIEPKDLIADVLRRIPESRRDDVVVLDPLDAAPVGINPLQRRRAGESRTPEVIADALFGVFHTLYGDSLGPRSSDILRNSLDALSRHPDASLVMLPLLLTNAGFRRRLTADLIRTDPIAAGPFWQWFDGLSPESAAQVIAPLQNKLRPLLSKSLRATLSQTTAKFNIRDVLTDNKILLVPLQKGVLGPESAQLLGAIVISELWQAIRERAGTPARTRTPVPVYIDEVQDYLKLPTADLDDALATSRSLGAAFHLSHQYRKQLPPAMLAAFTNNARSRICFQLASDDATAMADGQSVLSAQDFTSLPAYSIYAQLVRDNSVQPWTSGVTMPPPPETSNAEDIRRRSRERYGQFRDDIEAAFRQLLDLPAESAVATTNRRRKRTS